MSGKLKIYRLARRLQLAVPPSADGRFRPTDLQEHIAQAKGVTIELRFANDPMDPAKCRGIYELIDNQAVIWFGQMNPCWSRFTVAKELMHLMIDEPGDYSHNAADLLSDINLGTHFEPAADESEIAAELLAISYALGQDRPRDLSECSALDVAERYKVPVLEVQKFYAMLASEFNELDLLFASLRLTH